ncbi:hypothetical protein G7Y89_g15063 [Cudoniella acicularis]|uniref:Uncharacterized protein n=1 Tax=Cudoniella acicularis TaxID=354080 RepID=A0A8H4VQX9_9HELO|nr:hypothetical protein G7Y89_g15063 [Cudoniella acicularis]
MPPKAARGRGRGRGRGKAPAEPPVVPPPTQEASQSQPTIEEPSPPVAAPRITTPHDDLYDDAPDPSPNSSPATVPTETPAPTPNRPSILRPDSSNASESSSRGGRGGPGGVGRGRGRPAGESKFKPRAIRRDQSERDRLAEEDMKRKSEALRQEEADAERKEKAANRGRGFRGGRGRGDVMGRRGGRGNSASGLFGVAPEAMMRHREGEFTPIRAGGWTAGSGASGSRVKGEGGARSGPSGSGDYNSAYKGQGKNFFYEPSYPGFDGDDTPRIDIERINLVSDSDDEPVITSIRPVNKGKSKASKGGLKPIRLTREEHKERVTIVNTTSESSEPKVKKDDEMEIDENRSTRVVAIGDGVRVKREPSIELEYRPPAQDPPSPELHNRPEKSTKIDLSPAKEKKARQHSKKEVKPVLLTEEDKAEYERHLEDVRVLAEELGGMQTARDPDGDVAMGGADDEDHDKNGRKQSKEKKDDDKDVEVTGSASKPNESSKEVKVKTEEAPAVVVKAEEEETKESNDVVDEEGWIGKLIVRESGRVELSWGGTSMVVGRGVSAGFLSTGVMVDSLEKGVHYPNGEKPEGKALSMGQIMGKFVVVPDWEKMS